MLLRILSCTAFLVLAACSKPASDKIASAPVAEAPKAEAPPKTPPPEAQTAPSGLAWIVQKRGAGEARAALHDQIRVRFSAWNEKGKLVDSSEKQGGPVLFAMSGVIEGWRIAVPEMQVGEARRLWVPDALAYPGRPGSPRGMSIFDIELIEIVKAKPAPPAPPDVAQAPADAIKLKGGISYKVLSKGQSTERPNPWDRVAVRHAGWTKDSTPIPDAYSGERPVVYEPDQLQAAWRDVLPHLAIGDRARVWLPDAVFDLELVSIERKPEPPHAPADVAAIPRNAAKTASGLSYRFLTKGSGKHKPSAGARVEMHYSAWTTDGKLFDSSALRGKPVTLPLKKLIPGWSEGLQLMSEGDTLRLWIPEKLAYGGRPGAPRGMLVYDVELLRIE